MHALPLTAKLLTTRFQFYDCPFLKTTLSKMIISKNDITDAHAHAGTVHF